MTTVKIRAGLAASFLVLSVIVKAQSADSTKTEDKTADKTAEGRAAALTEKMKTQLALTDDQYPQVQAINLKYAQKNQAIFAGTEGRMAKFRSLQSSQKDKSKEMKAILTKDQYKMYEEMMDEMRQKTREEYKDRQSP